MLDKLKNITFEKWVSAFFLICVIAAILHGFALFKAWATDERTLPITSLILTGTHDDISTDSINKILLKQESKLNFFALDINRIQLELEKLPWVYSVSIRKEWPDTIKIHLVEQSIVATWNNKALLNRFGDVIEVRPDSVEKEFVSLRGGEGNEHLTLDLYNKLLQLIKVSKFKIAELSSNGRNATEIILKNGIVLKLGKEQKLDRIQRFLAVFPLIERGYDIGTISYVDLRYDTGVSIGWKKTDETKLNKTKI